MDTNVEIEVTRKDETGAARVVVEPDRVLIFEQGLGGVSVKSCVSIESGRLIVKAIADYDRAVAAVGGGE